MSKKEKRKKIVLTQFHPYCRYVIWLRSSFEKGCPRPWCLTFIWSTKVWRTLKPPLVHCFKKILLCYMQHLRDKGRKIFGPNNITIRRTKAKYAIYLNNDENEYYHGFGIAIESYLEGQFKRILEKNVK